MQSRPRARGTRYTATVRRGGECISASFWQKRQAEVWGRRCEEAMDAAREAGRPWDRAEWVRRGRDATVAELHGDLVALDHARTPDLSPLPRAD